MEFLLRKVFRFIYMGSKLDNILHFVYFDI